MTERSTERSRFRIVPIGSLRNAWGLEIDGLIRRSNHNALALAAYVDALIAGASEHDADFIARAIASRPWPTHAELMAVYTPTGGPEPSCDPFEKARLREPSRRL
jgi:hypothetical protein